MSRVILVIAAFQSFPHSSLAAESLWVVPSVHWQTAAISVFLSVAAECMRVYGNPGISPSVTSLQTSERCFFCVSVAYVVHSEKFSAFRPRFTSETTSQDAGATWLYQGHAVRFEWQSLQERLSMSETARLTVRFVCISRFEAIGGLVLAGWSA